MSAAPIKPQVYWPQVPRYGVARLPWATPAHLRLMSAAALLAASLPARADNLNAETASYLWVGVLIGGAIGFVVGWCARGRK